MHGFIKRRLPSRSNGQVSIREIARRAEVDPAVARRAVMKGVFPVRDPVAATRLKKILEELAKAGRGISFTHVTSGECTPVQIPLDHIKRSPAPVCQPGGASTAAETPNETTEEETMLLRNETLTQKAREHFGLARNPFSDDVHTRLDVFQSPNIRYVRAALFDAAMNHGFIAIVGESGAGKSTLAEELEQRILDERRPLIVIRPYILAMEDNDDKGKTLKSSQIAEAILRTLDPSGAPRNTPEARFRQVHALLKNSRAAGYSHVLLIEEAHCLPVATLKHLKRFLELKQGLSRLLGVALIGQPELKARLAEQKAEVREVVQRCDVIELAPLDNELDAYLKHKFERAGAKRDSILTDDALDALRARLIRIPRGGKAADAVSLCYPLVVGNLITRAMNAAALAGWPKVDAQVVMGC